MDDAVARLDLAVRGQGLHHAAERDAGGRDVLRVGVAPRLPDSFDVPDVAVRADDAADRVRAGEREVSSGVPALELPLEELHLAGVDAGLDESAEHALVHGAVHRLDELGHALGILAVVASEALQDADADVAAGPHAGLGHLADDLPGGPQLPARDAALHELPEQDFGVDVAGMNDAAGRLQVVLGVETPEKREAPRHVLRVLGAGAEHLLEEVLAFALERGLGKDLAGLGLGQDVGLGEVLLVQADDGAVDAGALHGALRAEHHHCAGELRGGLRRQPVESGVGKLEVILGRRALDRGHEQLVGRDAAGDRLLEDLDRAFQGRGGAEQRAVGRDGQLHVEGASASLHLAHRDLVAAVLTLQEHELQGPAERDPVLLEGLEQLGQLGILGGQLRDLLEDALLHARGRSYVPGRGNALQTEEGGLQVGDAEFAPEGEHGAHGRQGPGVLEARQNLAEVGQQAQAQVAAQDELAKARRDGRSSMADLHAHGRQELRRGRAAQRLQEAAEHLRGGLNGEALQMVLQCPLEVAGRGSLVQHLPHGSRKFGDVRGMVRRGSHGLGEPRKELR
mmetsp:Transcript_4193/g.12235  ORF Transcript_4193/g.12235 Transcript_4193/m.12235 type:complete len:567 (+) Transcript_4193:1270-2970(+)